MADGRAKRSRPAAPSPSQSAPAAGQLAGRIALITGASRGIGAAVAKRFAGEGAHVILAARTVGGLEEVDDAIQAAGGQATLVPVDITDFAKIDQMGAAIAQRFGRLDILVGNAGALGQLTPVGHIDPDDWDDVMRVNVTANWRLIRCFDPLLRRSEAGRAIFVTSGVANGVFPYWGAYATSKAALEMLAKVYAGEIAKTKVRVNLLDPGIVRTGMRAKAFPGEDPAKLAAPESVTDAFVHLASVECTFHGQVIRAY
ncbi:MAG: SDR family NAD(P)-dependent oxidoreductase [Alphaproteobacteria bacterium]|nr:SDR family NAD(P)-dependent oxidoreductase [Alphaproteobacteria bacterium]